MKKFRVQNIKLYELQEILTSFLLYVNFTACELKPHAKQSWDPRISTKTLLLKISMRWQYYHHTLAAGKLGNIDSNKT